MSESVRQPVELRVISDLYDFILWTHNHVAQFPNRSRMAIGNRMESSLLDILDRLLDAKFSKVKTESLRMASLTLEKVRFQYRLCYDTRVLSHKSHEHAVAWMQSIGNQIRGWLKHSQNG